MIKMYTPIFREEPKSFNNMNLYNIYQSDGLDGLRNMKKIGRQRKGEVKENIKYIYTVF